MVLLQLEDRFTLENGTPKGQRDQFFTEMMRAKVVCPVVFIIDDCGQICRPFGRFAGSVAGEQYLSDVHFPMIRQIREPFNSAKLDDLIGDWSDARRQASIKLRSSDHVE